MDRLERLYEIIELLRSRGVTPVSADELARHFGVTQRTIFRDISTLRDRDVPIHSEPGRDGGVWLGEEYSMPPVGLSIGEAIGLWLAYRIGAATTTGLPGDSLSTAMSKVLESLPSTQREKYASILDRIVVGIPPSTATLAEVNPIPSAIYRECENAIVTSHRLRIDYLDQRGNFTQRDVDPHGVLIQSPVWYLLTYDHLRDAPRMFRIDRVQQATIDPVLSFQPIDPRALFKEISEHSIELPGGGR